MRHARDDYDRIQDPAGLIPDDEPVFLLRAQDKLAWPLVHRYATLLQAAGGAPEMVKAANRHAIKMRRWLPKKLPDMPKPSSAESDERTESDMSTQAENEFEGWAIVELMGHRKLAGYTRQVDLFGAAMLRLDVPGTATTQGATQYYAPSAIYCITPTTEAIAKALAKSRRPEPVTRWELPAPEITPDPPRSINGSPEFEPDEDEEDEDVEVSDDEDDDFYN